MSLRGTVAEVTWQSRRNQAERCTAVSLQIVTGLPRPRLSSSSQ